jgi:hypothetical protein
MKRQVKLTKSERLMAQEVEVIQKIELKAWRSGWNVDKRHRIPNICFNNIFISHGNTELVDIDITYFNPKPNKNILNFAIQRFRSFISNSPTLHLVETSPIPLTCLWWSCFGDKTLIEAITALVNLYLYGKVQAFLAPFIAPAPRTALQKTMVVFGLLPLSEG